MRGISSAGVHESVLDFDFRSANIHMIVNGFSIFDQWKKADLPNFPSNRLRQDAPLHKTNPFPERSSNLPVFEEQDDLKEMGLHQDRYVCRKTKEL